MTAEIVRTGELHLVINTCLPNVESNDDQVTLIPLLVKYNTRLKYWCFYYFLVSAVVIYYNIVLIQWI